MAGLGHLMPGEKGTITVRVDTKGRNGRVEDTVDVLCNDPVRPRITLTLQAYITGDSP